MVINLYSTRTDKDHLIKSLNNSMGLSGHLKTSCDVVNPVIEIEHNALIFTNHINYAYIPDFGRYYYITDMRLNGKTLILSLHCDVLFTYATDIKGSMATIVRSQDGDKYIKDNRAIQTERIAWSCVDIGTAFRSGSAFILVKGVTG